MDNHQNTRQAQRIPDSAAAESLSNHRAVAGSAEDGDIESARAITELRSPAVVIPQHTSLHVDVPSDDFNRADSLKTKPSDDAIEDECLSKKDIIQREFREKAIPAELLIDNREKIGSSLPQLTLTFDHAGKIDEYFKLICAHPRKWSQQFILEAFEALTISYYYQYHADAHPKINALCQEFDSTLLPRLYTMHYQAHQKRYSHLPAGSVSSILSLSQYYALNKAAGVNHRITQALSDADSTRFNTDILRSRSEMHYNNILESQFKSLMRSSEVESVIASIHTETTLPRERIENTYLFLNTLKNYSINHDELRHQIQSLNNDLYLCYYPAMMNLIDDVNRKGTTPAEQLALLMAFDFIRSQQKLENIKRGLQQFYQQTKAIIQDFEMLEIHDELDETKEEMKNSLKEILELSIKRLASLYKFGVSTYLRLLQGQRSLRQKDSKTQLKNSSSGLSSSTAIDTAPREAATLKPDKRVSYYSEGSNSLSPVSDSASSGSGSGATPHPLPNSAPNLNGGFSPQHNYAIISCK